MSIWDGFTAPPGAAVVGGEVVMGPGRQAIEVWGDWGYGGYQYGNTLADYQATQRAALQAAAAREAQLRAEAEARVAAEVKRIAEITQNAINTVAEMMKNNLAQLTKSTLPGIKETQLPTIQSTITKLESLSRLPSVNITSMSDLINDLKRDVNQIYGSVYDATAASQSALADALSQQKQDVTLTWNNVLGDVDKVVSNAKTEIKTFDPIPSIFRPTGYDRDLVEQLAVNATVSQNQVKTTSYDNIFDIYNTGVDAIRTAQTPAAIDAIEQSTTEGFKSLAGMILNANSAIKSIFSKASDLAVEKNVDSTNYWINQAIGSPATLALTELDRGVDEILNKYNEKDVFDVHRIEARKIIDEQFPNLEESLREYANVVAPYLVDVAMQSPEEIKDYLARSEPFKFVLTEALTAGLPEDVTQNIIEIFGNKVYTQADFESMAPVDVSDKFFRIESGLTYVSPTFDVSFLSPGMQQVIGDQQVPLLDAKSIEALIQQMSGGMGQVRIQNVWEGYYDAFGGWSTEKFVPWYWNDSLQKYEPLVIPTDATVLREVDKSSQVYAKLDSLNTLIKKEYKIVDPATVTKFAADGRPVGTYVCVDAAYDLVSYLTTNGIEGAHIAWLPGNTPGEPNHMVVVASIGETVYYITPTIPSDAAAPVPYLPMSDLATILSGGNPINDYVQWAQSLYDKGKVIVQPTWVALEATAEHLDDIYDMGGFNILIPLEMFEAITVPGKTRVDSLTITPIDYTYVREGFDPNTMTEEQRRMNLTTWTRNPVGPVGYEVAATYAFGGIPDLKDLSAYGKVLYDLVQKNPAAVYGADFDRDRVYQTAAERQEIATMFGFDTSLYSAEVPVLGSGAGRIGLGVWEPIDISNVTRVAQLDGTIQIQGWIEGLKSKLGIGEKSEGVGTLPTTSGTITKTAAELTASPPMPSTVVPSLGVPTASAPGTTVPSTASVTITANAVTVATGSRFTENVTPNATADRLKATKDLDTWVGAGEQYYAKGGSTTGMTATQLKLLDVYGLPPQGFKPGSDPISNYVETVIKPVVSQTGSTSIEEATIKASGLPDVDKAVALTAIGVPGYTKTSLADKITQYGEQMAPIIGFLAKSDTTYDLARYGSAFGIVPGTALGFTINSFPEVKEAIGIFVEPILYKPDARFELADLAVDGRATDRGKEVANTVAQILMVTGGSLDWTKMDPDKIKTIENITAGTGVRVDTVFPNMIVLDDGRRFGETVIKEFTLSVVEDTTLKNLMAAAGPNLVITNADAYGKAAMRIDSVEANTLKVDVVNKNNVVSTIGNDGKQYNIQAGMDPNLFESLLKQELITRNTGYDGTLQLTAEGRARKNELVTMLAYAIEATPHGETVKLPGLSVTDQALVSFGLDKQDIGVLAGRREGIDQFGQPIVQQSIIDRVTTNPDLVAAIERRVELQMAADNPGDLVLANQMASWLDKGWIDVDGSVTPAGIGARDKLVSEFVTGAVPEVKSTSQIQMDRAFMFATADTDQLKTIGKEAYYKLAPSEQLVAERPEMSIGDRIAQISYATGDFLRGAVVSPMFDDPGLNAAFFGLGILPTGWFSKGAKGVAEIVKIADAPGGITKLADMFLGMKGATKQADQMDLMAAAKRDLSPEKYMLFREAISSTPTGAKYLEDFSLITSSLRVAGPDDVAKIASMSPERLLLEANQASNMAFFGGMKDGDWVKYLDNLQSGGVSGETLKNLDNVRNGYLRVTADMFRPVEHMDPVSISQASRASGMWHKIAEVPANMWDATVGTLTKNGADAKDLVAMRNLGELRTQRIAAAGKTDFISLFDNTPLTQISKSDAALLSPNELDALLSRSPADLSLRHSVDDIQNLMTRRVEGQADLIRSSTDYGKLTQAEKDVLTKFETSRVFNLTPAEQQTLTDLTNKIGVSRMSSLAESIGARMSFDTFAAIASYPVTHPLHTVGAALATVYLGKQAYDVAVAGPCFALFLSEEAGQFAFLFGPMSADEDPLRLADSLVNGIVMLREIQDHTPLKYLLAMQDAPYSQYWAPTLTNGLIHQYRAVPNAAESHRDKLVAMGAWIMDDNETSYLWSYDKDGKEIVKVLQGRPATRDEFLDNLDNNPAYLSRMSAAVYKDYIDMLYAERGWNDDRLTQEWINKTIVGYALENATPQSVVDRVDAYNKDEVNKLGMPLPEFIGLGNNLSDIWKNPRVQAEFRLPDGKYDVSKLSDAVLGGQISIWALNTHSPDAAVALLKEGTYNPDPKYKETRNKIMADDDGFALAMQTYTPGSLMAMAQHGAIPADQLYKLKSIEPDVEKIAALPSTVPYYAPSYDSNGKYIPYAKAEMEHKVNHILTDEGIDSTTKGAWFGSFRSAANPYLNDNDIGYLYSIGSIPQTELYNWTTNHKDISGTVDSLRQSGVDPVTYYKDRMDREFLVPIPSFVGLVAPYGAKDLSVRPAGLDAYPTLQMALTTPGYLSSNLTGFTKEMAALYAADPDTALRYWVSVAKNTPDLDRSAAYATLPPGLQSAVSAYNSDPSNFTTGGRADADKGSWVTGTSLYWTDANNKQRFVDLTGGEYGRGSVYDVETGKWVSVADAAAKLGVSPDSIKFDMEAYLNWVAGKSDSKNFIIAADQKTASKISGGGGGGGGRGGGGYSSPVTYPSATTGIFIDCNVDAEISINNMLMGRSNQLIPLSPGEYTVTISATGYTAKTMVITVLTTRATNMSVTLYRGALTICDFVTAVGGSFAVDKIHFVYAYCMYRGWTEAAAEALKHFTKPTMQPDKFTKNDCTFVYSLAMGKYNEANAMIETGVVCS